MPQSAKLIAQISTPPFLARWQRALSYFQERKAVIFVSYCRFWEHHAFVQQSLAKLLTDHGVKVTWYDAETWKGYRPTLYWKSEHLDVKSRFTLPGRRWRFIEAIDKKLFQSTINKEIRKYGDPIIWIQGGLRESLAEVIPKIDVFSTFDDPFYFANDSVIKQKAKLIVAQNSFTWRMHCSQSDKSKMLLPPVDMKVDESGSPNYVFPERFPKKVMGYIGSFFHEDYDLELLEYLIRTLPDWGFLLVGRTNAVGEGKVKTLKRYANFHHVAWAPRAQVMSLWKKLSVTLLLHRPRRVQYGAFPTKVLESLAYGVPCVGTEVPKTNDLQGFFPISSFPSELRQMAVQAAGMDKERIRQLFDLFSSKSDPALHLIEVAESLMPANG